MWDNFYLISLQVLSKEKQNTERVYQDPQPKNVAYSEPETCSESWLFRSLGYSEPGGILRTLSNICSGAL